MAEPTKSLSDLIRSFARYGKKPAIIAMQQQGCLVWSYDRLQANIDRMTTEFAAVMNKGEVIALCGDNSP